MKERPILFSGPMVRALLAGTKTQTRRVVKPVGGDDSFVLQDYGNGWWPYRSDDGETPMKDDNEIPHACPYGTRGDRLWVREAWKAHTTFDHLPPRDIPQSHVWYMADDGYKAESRYRQGMFMPRWASRITLEVTGVRVERLQAISEGDAVAEGIERDSIAWRHYLNPVRFSCTDPRQSYQTLWESINGPGSWDANPWVWCVTFKRVEPA